MYYYSFCFEVFGVVLRTLKRDNVFCDSTFRVQGLDFVISVL